MLEKERIITRAYWQKIENVLFLDDTVLCVISEDQTVNAHFKALDENGRPFNNPKEFDCDIIIQLKQGDLVVYLGEGVFVIPEYGRGYAEFRVREQDAQIKYIKIGRFDFTDNSANK